MGLLRQNLPEIFKIHLNMPSTIGQKEPIVLPSSQIKELAQRPTVSKFKIK